MVSKKLVAIVKQGRSAIAKWRRANSGILLDLTETDLTGADLQKTDLRRAILVGTDLTGANLTGATLSRCDLTRANLSKVIAHRADFSNAQLFKTTLNHASMTGACLEKARLKQADLSFADLTRVRLNESDLSHAYLRNAILVEADLSRARLWGASLEHAVFGGTGLGNLDLLHVTGLESATHIGPSTIGIDTFFLSKGKLPQPFLRGCGVAEDLIQNRTLLAEHPWKNVLCHIVFNSEDSSFANKLFDSLQSRGIRCWLREQTRKDESDDAPQPDWRMYPQDAFLVCLSKPSLSGDWIDELVETARATQDRYQKELNLAIQLVYPLNLDGYLFSGQQKFQNEKSLTQWLAADFSGWRRNETKFDQEFEKLLDAFKSR